MNEIVTFRVFEVVHVHNTPNKHDTLDECMGAQSLF